MLIVLSGLPGVGKTTIARELSRRLGAVHIRIDSIEQAIKSSGVTVVSLDDAGYRVGYAVAADNLRLGHIVVADSVNPIPVTRDAWQAVAERGKVACVEVEIVCSDVAEHRRRVESRAAPSWPEVLARDYRPWTGRRIVIDTATRSVQDVVSALLTELPGGQRGARR